MTLDDFITTVFCVTDDFLASYLGGRRLRKRGPHPTVLDSVVVTCELVGEFLGYDTDSGIYRYIRRHHLDLFPAMGQIHRTTFARQAANLWKIKERLQSLLQRMAHADRQLSMRMQTGSFRLLTAFRSRSAVLHGPNGASDWLASPLLAMTNWPVRRFTACVVMCALLGRE